MARMGHGYGSEFHLLRWMGRHRNEFTRRAAKAVGSKTVEWFDFDFDFRNGNAIPDRELHGFSFLHRKPPFPSETHKLFEAVRGRGDDNSFLWPGAARSISWDAVGRTESGLYVLCEAKAHVEELKSSISRKTCDESRKTIGRTLENTKRRLGVTSSADWRNGYYQLANRMYALTVLDHFGVEAVLLNIYFVGDEFPAGDFVCPADESEWQTAIDDEYAGLGIPRHGNAFVDMHVRELFLPVSRPRNVSN